MSTMFYVGLTLVALGLLLCFTPQWFDRRLNGSLRRLPGYSALEARLWRSSEACRLLELILGCKRYYEAEREWLGYQFGRKV